MPSVSGEATAILRCYESPELLYKDVSLVDEQDLYAGDFWGFSVLIHELLTKTLPFEPTVNLASGSQINPGAPNWGLVSAECKDFVMRALRRNSQNRLTLEEALGHPWLTKALNCTKATANQNFKVTKAFETMK